MSHPRISPFSKTENSVRFDVTATTGLRGDGGKNPAPSVVSQRAQKVPISRRRLARLGRLAQRSVRPTSRRHRGGSAPWRGGLPPRPRGCACSHAPARRDRGRSGAVTRTSRSCAPPCPAGPVCPVRPVPELEYRSACGA